MKPAGNGCGLRGPRKETADPSTSLPSDFLSGLVASASFMRLSLRKAAHAFLSKAAQPEIRVRSGRDDKGEGDASMESGC
jgi:hypothetical protein